MARLCRVSVTVLRAVAWRPCVSKRRILCAVACRASCGTFTWANFVLSTMRKDSPCSLQQTRLSDAGDETISKSLMRKGATCARKWHSRVSGTGVGCIGGFRGYSRLNQSGGRRALCQKRLLVVEATRSLGW